MARICPRAGTAPWCARFRRWSRTARSRSSRCSRRHTGRSTTGQRVLDDRRWAAVVPNDDGVDRGDPLAMCLVALIGQPGRGSSGQCRWRSTWMRVRGRNSFGMVLWVLRWPTSARQSSAFAVMHQHLPSRWPARGTIRARCRCLIGCMRPPRPVGAVHRRDRRQIREYVLYNFIVAAGWRSVRPSDWPIPATPRWPASTVFLVLHGQHRPADGHHRADPRAGQRSGPIADRDPLTVVRLNRLGRTSP